MTQSRLLREYFCHHHRIESNEIINRKRKSRLHVKFIFVAIFQLIIRLNFIPCDLWIIFPRDYERKINNSNFYSSSRFMIERENKFLIVYHVASNIAKKWALKFQNLASELEQVLKKDISNKTTIFKWCELNVLILKRTHFNEVFYYIFDCSRGKKRILWEHDRSLTFHLDDCHKIVSCLNVRDLFIVSHIMRIILNEKKLQVVHR